jgi:phage tail-like protein
MPTTVIPEALRAYNFAVDIDGSVQGYFTHVSGLQAQIQTIDYREGGGQNVQKLRGRVAYGEVELWYGVTTNLDMWRWMEDALKRDAYKKNLSIVLLDHQRQRQVVAWNLINAWPCRWHAKPLDGLASEVAVESLSLAFDYFERVAN